MQFLASSRLSTKTTSPFFSLTIGPSIESQELKAVLFPGLSTFNCVPIAIYPDNNSMVQGFIPILDNPVFLHLPNLSLNPPARKGYVNTGLPATISEI